MPQLGVDDILALVPVPLDGAGRNRFTAPDPRSPQLSLRRRCSDEALRPAGHLHGKPASSAPTPTFRQARVVLSWRAESRDGLSYRPTSKLELAFGIITAMPGDKCRESPPDPVLPRGTDPDSRPAALWRCRARESRPLTSTDDDVWVPANQFGLSRRRDTWNQMPPNGKKGRSYSPR